MDSPNPPGNADAAERQRQRELEALKHKADQKWRRLRNLSTRAVRDYTDANENVAQAEINAALNWEQAALIREHSCAEPNETHQEKIIEHSDKFVTETNKRLEDARQRAKKAFEKVARLRTMEDRAWEEIEKLQHKLQGGASKQGATKKRDNALPSSDEYFSPVSDSDEHSTTDSAPGPQTQQNATEKPK